MSDFLGGPDEIVGSKEYIQRMYGFAKNVTEQTTSTFSLKDLDRLRNAKSCVEPDPMMDWYGSLAKTAELHKRKK